jgi:hypothetical protein
MGEAPALLGSYQGLLSAVRWLSILGLGFASAFTALLGAGSLVRLYRWRHLSDLRAALLSGLLLALALRVLWMR